MSSNGKVRSGNGSRHRRGTAKPLALCAALAALALAGGCQPQWTWSWETNSWQKVQPAAPAKPPNADVDDPCAERLHDIEGQLLLYYQINRRMPARLEDLNGLTTERVLLTCPVTGRPYAYNPEGIEFYNSILDKEQRIIVWDSVPCRPGKRHVIVADPIQRGKPLIIQVPAPMENGPLFTMNQPASAPARNRDANQYR